MPQIFFESRAIAQEVAKILQLDWDGCNSISYISPDDEAFLTAVSLVMGLPNALPSTVDGTYYLEGTCCDLATKQFYSTGGISIWSSPETCVQIIAEQGISSSDSFFGDAADRVLGSLFALDESAVLWRRDELKQKVLEVEVVPKVSYL